VAECPTCGVSVGKDARFCAQCGGRLDGSTKVLEVPAVETGAVPVHVERVEPRFYGVTPSAIVLALAGISLTLAIVLFATGRWPVGLVLAGLTVLLALTFVETARRRPLGSGPRATADALEGFRDRAGAAAGAVATRGVAASRLLALRRERLRLERERSGLLFRLGEAVYRDDEQATERVRRELEELDRLVTDKEGQMEAVVEGARGRIERRRLEVQPTEIAEPRADRDGDFEPPEPARIPEPYPPPDEGSPPQPAVIPEPGPAVLPEPGPAPETPGSPEEGSP
jgi:hypothetical protein